jgi:hypothetical protein
MPSTSPEMLFYHRVSSECAHFSGRCHPIIVDVDAKIPSPRGSKAKVLAKEIALVVRDLPSKKPEDSDEKAAAPSPRFESSADGHTSAGSARDPIIIEMDVKVSASRSQSPNEMPLTHPDFDKENQPAPAHHNLPDPVVTTEKEPEVLAKELVRAAIDFERRHRFATAYCVFKRAYQLLPKKSAKLFEWLARLEREYPAAANHVPASEMPTSEFMTCVLERDLMEVLNQAQLKNLQSSTRSVPSVPSWCSANARTTRFRNCSAYPESRPTSSLSCTSTTLTGPTQLLTPESREVPEEHPTLW